MGWTFLPVDSLPAAGDVVWCRWPHFQVPGKPGPDARPVLVRHSETREHLPTATMYGVVQVSYGTGQRLEENPGLDLVIAPNRRARELGLHKSTRFSLDERSRKVFLWCEEFFVAPSYVKNAGILIGRLNEAEREAVAECMRQRALA